MRLVGGFKDFLCSIIYGIILPSDYFSRWLKPPTRRDKSTKKGFGFDGDTLW